VYSCPKIKGFDGIKPEDITEVCSLLSGKWYG
jgi:hypothetical protein